SAQNFLSVTVSLIQSLTQSQNTTKTNHSQALNQSSFIWLMRFQHLGLELDMRIWRNTARDLRKWKKLPRITKVWKTRMHLKQVVSFVSSSTQAAWMT